VRIAVVAQVLAGIANLLLLAPVGMQIVHLVLADVVWIAVVALGARALAETDERRESIEARAVADAAAE
jgi:cytochrome c oxidase assembly protein subunit 15